MHHFISYSHADAKEFAIKLADYLAADPPIIKSWIDIRDIRPGEDWDEQVDFAIKTCESLIFVMTQDSVEDASPCKLEWSQALKYKKPIFPIRLGLDSDLPFELNSRHYIDFRSSFTTGLDQLRRHISQLAKPKIVFVGCGGAGNNTINRIQNIGISGVETIAINTDKQHLDIIQADKRILIGKSLTKGLGSGGYPEIGKRAAEMDKPILEPVFDSADLVFVTLGMGGGTGTGSAPVVAQIAKDQGALVIGIVSYPFQVEKARLKRADEGLDALAAVADTVIILDNNKVKNFAPNLSLNQSFSVMDQLIAETVKGISETISEPSFVNIDCNDIREVIGNGGISVMLMGESQQPDNAKNVVQECINHSMTDIDYRGATGSLIHIIGGPDLTLEDTEMITSSLTDKLDPSTKVICSASIRNDMEGKVRVHAIMTGIKNSPVLGAVPSHQTFIQNAGKKMCSKAIIDPLDSGNIKKPRKKEICPITDVQFSVTCPKKVKPGSSFILDIWAHLEKQRKEILNRSTLGYVDSDITLRSSGVMEIKSETPISIRLEIQNFTIENPENPMIWAGKIVNTSFLIKVPEDVPQGNVIGKAKIFIEGFQVACILFELLITDTTSSKENIQTSSHYNKSAFVSYSRLDLDRVLARIQGIQKAAPYLKIIMDIKDIQSGEKWKEKLRSLIGDSDIFYLFWSKNASQSDWVNKEWKCAYKLKGIDFIDPIPLDPPHEVLPPPELAEKHFDEWTLAYERKIKINSKEDMIGLLEWVG